MIVPFDTILTATQPEDIFGYNENLTAEELLDFFKAVRKQVHPDKNGDSKESTDSFVILEAMYDEALRKIQSNVYGQSYLLRITSVSPPVHYDVNALFESTPFSDIYTAHSHNAVGTSLGEVLLSVSSEPKLNSYMVAEAKLLDDVYQNPSFAVYVPQILNSFIYSFNGTQRHINVLDVPQGYVSLETILEAYPGGLPAKDMAWIYRRLLDILGYIHSLGYIHGAVLPCNILVGLGDIHQVKLINWHCSISLNTPLKARYSAYTYLYPPEIEAKEKVTPSVDLYMAAKCMLMLTDPGINERPILGFLNSCIIKNIAERPQDSWGVRKQFSMLIDKIWAEREYRPLYLTTK